MRWFLRLFNWGIGMILLFVVFSNIWIVSDSDGKIYSSLEHIPQIDTAIVFGTSKYKVGGGNNPFFENRMKAAAELYHSKKVKSFILSGSRDQEYYNEPENMKESLLQLGVSQKSILLDTAGTRTLDTIIGAKRTHNLNSVVLITQEYHAHRALFISDHFGLKAVCYRANLPESNFSYKSIIREILARPKAILDLFFTY